MSGMIAWFARNPVAANLMMVFIIVSGAMATFIVNAEVFPEVSLDTISIEVPYLGAAPEEVELAVCVRIEEAVQGIDGIKTITATAAEGMGRVLIELELDADSRKVIDDVKNSVDAITTFPAETEKPIVRELLFRNKVIDVAVSGRADELTLKTVAERVRDEIAAVPGISLVEITSARPYEIAIEVSEVALRRHGLTFDDVATAVRRSSLDIPGGSVRAADGEILLRTIGQAYRGGEFESLIVRTRADGTRLHLRDVATVVDGFAETDQSARFDDEAAILVSVFRTGDQNAMQIASLVHDYVARSGPAQPPGVSIAVWQDAGAIVSARLQLMLKTGLSGFILVFVLLALFLEARLAFWGSLGIPIFVPGRDHADAEPRRDGEHTVAVRVHPGTGHRGRRRDHCGRAHPYAPGTVRGPAGRGDRRRAGHCHPGRLRRADNRGGLHAAHVRPRADGQVLPGHSPHRHSRPALFAAGVARHPARASGPSAAGAQGPPGDARRPASRTRSSASSIPSTGRSCRSACAGAT